MGRAPFCDKANVKRGPWSPEEDAKLKSYIEQNGTGDNWIALPQKIGLKRCGRSCRLRWLNYLRPNIRHGGFSEEEDNIICSLYINIGSRWSIIAAQLPGRTDNDIKNYWNTRLKKKILGKQPKQPPPRRATLRQETTHSFPNMNQQHIASYSPEPPCLVSASAPSIQALDNMNTSDQIAMYLQDPTYGNSLSSMSSGDSNYSVDNMFGNLPIEMVYGHENLSGSHYNGVYSVESGSWGLDYSQLLSEFENCLYNLPQQHSSFEVSSYLPSVTAASGKWHGIL